MKNDQFFECQKCGNCCRVEGYVPVALSEVMKISQALGIEESFFINEFMRFLPDKRGLSLNEKKTGECIFLQQNNKCAIHEEKPQHCKDFPLKWHFCGYEKICMARWQNHELQNN